MITLRIARLTPDSRGRPQFQSLEVPFRPDFNVCDELALAPAKIDRVIYLGRSYQGDDVLMIPVVEGAELHVLPLIDGKNASLILGVVGAIVGFYIGGAYGAQAGWAWGAALQGAMTGFAIGSTIGTLMQPKPKLDRGDGALSTYQFQGITNSDLPGSTIPVVLGKRKTGGLRIGAFIRREGTTVERMGVLILVSWGEVAALDDIQLNDQPIANFPTAQVHKRFGIAGQDPIPGFNAIANTFAQNVDITALAPAFYQYTTNRTDCDAFEVLLTIPGLSHLDSKGRVRPMSTSYNVTYSLHGANVWTNLDPVVGFKTLTASTRTTFFETRRVEGLAPGQYDIRILFENASNVDGAPDATTDQWHIFLTGITEEKQDARNYDDYALVGVTGIAAEQLNGALPTCTTLCSGIKFAQWTGAGWTAPTFSRLAAWNTLGLIRDKRFGLGNRLPDNKIALGVFKDWGDWCAENYHVVMDNGTEFDEQRHYLDVVLNQQSPARDVLLKLHRAGRASFAFLDGVLTPVMDREGDPVQMFGMGNIDEGSFQIQYLATAGLTNAFDVTINDETRNYDPNTKQVLSRQEVIVLGRPIKSDQVTRECTTRMTQAIRDTRLELNAMHYLRRIVTFGVNAQAILSQAGDLIRLAHDAAGWGFSGRILPGGDNHWMSLDQPVVIDATQIYELTIHHNATDLVEIVPVWGADQTYGSGIYNQLQVHGVAAEAALEGDSYSFGPPNISTKPFRILAITITDESKRRVTCLEYNQSVVDDSGVIAIIPYTQLPNLHAGAPPIAFVNVYEQVAVRNDDRWVSDLLIQWPRPAAGREYGAYAGAKIERSFNYDPLNPSAATWEDFAFTQGTEYRWQDVPHEMTIGIRVIPMAQNGRFNLAGAAVGYVTTQGYTTAAPQVTNFVGFIKDNAFVWTWDDPGQQYQVELRTANSGWGDNNPAVLLYRGFAQKFQIMAPASRVVQLFAKVIDAHHNVSVAAVSATITSLAPQPPVFLGAVRSKLGVSVVVGPPLVFTGHEVALHLHASTDPTFVPSAANRVGQVVGTQGGSFFISTIDPARLYFYATTEDWLSARLNDWIYSARSDSSQLYVVPVDPYNVLVSQAVDNVHGHPVGGNPVSGTPGSTVDIINPARVDLQFDFVDDPGNPPGSLIGAEMILYSTDPTQPDRTTGVVPIGEISSGGGVTRFWSFHSVHFNSPTTLYGAVRMIYIEGVVSDMVSSNFAVVLTANPTDPPITTTDSPLTHPYLEEFIRSGTMPGGFTTGAGVSSIVVDPTASGQLRFTVDGSANAWLDFDPFVWASLYIDTKRVGAAGIVTFRMSAPVGRGISAIQILTDSGNNDAFTRAIGNVIDDGLLHNYSGLFGHGGGTLTFIGSTTPHVRMLFQGVTAATVITIDNFGIGFFGYGFPLNAEIDRALQARNQFLKVLSSPGGPGGGFQMTAPIAPIQVDGSQVLIDGNGIFFTPSGGAMIEPGYRAGQKGDLGPMFSGFPVYFKKPTATDAAFYAEVDVPHTQNPPLAEPVGLAVNKIRLLVEQKGSVTIDAAPAQYPVREWYELTDFFVGHGWSLFTTAALTADFYGILFFGGIANQFADVGPWAQSTTRKSALALHRSTNDRLTPIGGNLEAPTADDAWWYGKGLLTDTNVNTYYFRETIWIKVVAPLLLKANGSPYYMDLLFTLYHTEGATDVPNNRMNLADYTTLGANGVKGGPSMRIYTDGGTYRMPIPSGNPSHTANDLAGNPVTRIRFQHQCFVVRWADMRAETGVSALLQPTSVEVEKILLDYLSPNGAVNPSGVALGDMRFSITAYNEF